MYFRKRFLFLINCSGLFLLLILPFILKAQTPADAIFFNNGALIYTAPGSIIHTNGGFTNGDDTLNHYGNLFVNNSGTDGSIYLTGSSVTQGDGNYHIEQNWLNDATFNANASEVELFGSSSDQLITGNVSTTFNNLTLTNTTGTQVSKIKRLTLDAVVTGQLKLNDRELATGDNALFITNPSVSAITNATVPGNEGFVSSDNTTTGLGVLSRVTNANQAYLFPTGSSTGITRYRPVEITPASSAPNNYTVRMANVDATTEGYNRSSNDSIICVNNPYYYHRINNVFGTDEANITFFYDQVADGNWNGVSQWNILNNSAWNSLGQVSSGTNGIFNTITKNNINFFDNNDTPFILSQIRPPAPELTGNAFRCSNEPYSSYSVSGNPASTYTWYIEGGVIISDSTKETVLVDWIENYGSLIVVENISGSCNSQASAAYTVNNIPAPVANFSTSFSGPLSQLVAFKDSSINGMSWYWDFGDGSSSTTQSPSHNYPNSGEYTAQLIVEGDNGCSDTASFPISIIESIMIPNVFSPNDDGKNDWFYIPNTGLGDFNIVIFNRWGTKIWETTAPEIRWDGRANSGIPASEGTYFYILKAVSSKNDYSTNGTVTLFR